MATNNLYTPQIVGLEGGLDFTTPKLAATPGSLSDCYNFEVTDRLGYARIMGYERFDGGYAPSLAYTNIITLLHNPIDGSLDLIREPVSTEFDPSRPFGMVVTHTDTETTVAVEDFAAFEPLLMFLQEQTSFPYVKMSTHSGDVEWEITGFRPENNIDAAHDAAVRNNLFKGASSRVKSIDTDTQKSPIIGLEFYKDKLYAVRNLNRIYFEEGSIAPNVGDVLLTFAGEEVKVLEVVLSTGTWDDEDAVGYILTYSPVDSTANGPASNEVTGDTDVLTFVNSPATAKELLKDVTQAGMWVSGGLLDPGWTPVDLGWEFTFRAGTSEGPPRTYFRGTLVGAGPETQTKVAVANNVIHGNTWAPSSGTAVEALAEKDDGSFLVRTSSTVNPGLFSYVSTYNFDSALNVPADATVNGIKVTIRAAATGTSAVKRFDVQLWTPAAFLGTSKSAAFTTDLEDYVLGGDGDNWGIENLKEAIKLPDFGFTINPYQSAANSATWGYDYAEMAVTYTRSIENYYFWDGDDDVQAEITNYFVDEGDWTLNDAHGFMQVNSMKAYGSGTRTHIKVGDEIRTMPNGDGELIAIVESTPKYAYLPGLKPLEDNNSRYQMIVANFYGNEDWEAIYGVNGAGRGFSYDGYYFRRLYTGLSEDIDKPRHIIFFQHHLGLGYAAGNLTLSVQGEPENFSGELGASSWDVGDPITGLIRMNGSTLGIACKDSINSLTGSNIDDFSIRCINPYEGAIEYTVIDVGKPVYCSYKGISLFEQTAAYGDYLGTRLSANITSWLVPRLQGRSPPIDIYAGLKGNFIQQTASTGPLVAIPCRSRNQMRLYFKDGTILTMTLMGAEQKPVFTFQSHLVYPSDSDDAYSNLIPRAENSATDSKGRERIHVSHYNYYRDSESLDDKYFVYESEKSWTFDGRGIPAYFVTNSNFKDQPFIYGKIAKVRVNGLSYGYAPCKVLVTEGYTAVDVTKIGQQEYQDINLPRAATHTLGADFIPYTNIANVPKEGTSFNLTFLSYDTANRANPFAFKSATPCPPFALQTLLLQTTPAKGDV